MATVDASPALPVPPADVVPDPPSSIDPLAQREAQPGTTPASEVPAAPEALADAAVSGARSVPEGVDGYLPRKVLTRAPRPRSEITMAWPPGILPLGRQTDVFTVFIDENGQVRRMVPDSASLPPALEAAARETFAAAFFDPGELDGRPVKSMIRIEVVFESTVAPLPGAVVPPAPTIVSRQNL